MACKHPLEIQKGGKIIETRGYPTGYIIAAGKFTRSRRFKISSFINLSIASYAIESLSLLSKLKFYVESA